MPKSGKEIIKILVKLGWIVKGQRGSHVKLQKGEVLVIVPVHSNKTLGIGLVRAIEKQTGEKIL